MTKINRLFETVTADLDATAAKAAEATTQLDISTNKPLSIVLHSAHEALLRELPRTEATASKRLHKVYGHHVSYVEPENVWYVWNGRIHEPVNTDAIAHKMIDALWDSLKRNIDEVEAAWDKLEQDKQTALRKTWSRHRTYRDRLAAAAGKSALITLMKMDFRVDDDHFLDDRRWFVVQNGVFDMDAVRENRRFDRLEHSPERPVYRMLDMEDVPGAEYPALMQFLTGSIADMTQASFLSKAVAYAVLGAPKKTKRIVSIQGAHNSGKSMIQDCLSRLCNGTGFYAAPGEAAITHHGKNKEHARYKMRNARYISFSEVQSKLDDAFIKAYTGGDPYAIEEKFVPSSSVTPQGIIFVAGNNPLDVDKIDPAMFKRVATVSFPHTFDKADPEHLEDETLGDRIVAEGSGFLEWLKTFYLIYLAEGLDKSESMEALLRGEASDSDTVAGFLGDRIESGKYRKNHDLAGRKCAMLSDLHLDYVEYCRGHETERRDILKKSAFRDRLSTLGHPYVRADGSRMSGIEVRDPSSISGFLSR